MPPAGFAAFGANRRQLSPCSLLGAQRGIPTSARPESILQAWFWQIAARGRGRPCCDARVHGTVCEPKTQTVHNGLQLAGKPHFLAFVLYFWKVGGITC